MILIEKIKKQRRVPEHFNVNRGQKAEDFVPAGSAVIADKRKHGSERDTDQNRNRRDDQCKNKPLQQIHQHMRI